MEENNVAAMSLDPQRAIRDARAEGMRQGIIQATVRDISTLMRKLKLSPQEVMTLLELSKKERKTYSKIFDAIMAQKKKPCEGAKRP